MAAAAEQAEIDQAKKDAHDALARIQQGMGIDEAAMDKAHEERVAAAAAREAEEKAAKEKEAEEKAAAEATKAADVKVEQVGGCAGCNCSIM